MFILGYLIACGEKPPNESGEYLYDVYCGICHGMDGEGYLAPQANALANPEFLAAATDEFLIESTIYGRPDSKMSAWGDVANGPLNEEQISLIVDYIRTWQTLPTEDVHDLIFDGNIENGQLVYNENCASCHGQDGAGESAMSINNPEFLRVASNGFIWHAIVYGRSNTTMQSYQDLLTEQEIEDLVSLIRSWKQ
jgi:cytochrome c oxidase cbb3-type subunit III